MAKKTGVKIKAGNVSFSFLLTDRDWKILHTEEMFLHGAERFIKALGLYDNYSVRDGTATDSKVIRTWMEFYSDVVDLSRSVISSEDRLNFNYILKPFPLPKIERPLNKYGAFKWFGFDAAFSRTKLHAHLSLKLYQEGADGKQLTVGYIDLRSEKSIQTEQHGEIKILRRKKETVLAETLKQLIEFLIEHKDEEITIFHN